MSALKRNIIYLMTFPQPLTAILGPEIEITMDNTAVNRGVLENRLPNGHKDHLSVGNNDSYEEGAYRSSQQW